MTGGPTSFPADGERPVGGEDPGPVIEAAREQGCTLATAESLTAGAVVARLVDVPGASAVVVGGAACYTAAAKARVLGLDESGLLRDGAVREEVAIAMAEGARTLYDAELAVSTTGVAGPGPDGHGVPAGTVWIGVARAGRPSRAVRLHAPGDRAAVRRASVDGALRLLGEELAVSAPGNDASS